MFKRAVYVRDSFVLAIECVEVFPWRLILVAKTPDSHLVEIGCLQMVAEIKMFARKFIKQKFHARGLLSVLYMIKAVPPKQIRREASGMSVPRLVKAYLHGLRFFKRPKMTPLKMRCLRSLPAAVCASLMTH